MPGSDGWNGYQSPVTPVLNGQQNRSYTEIIDTLERSIRGISRTADEIIQSWINTGVQRLCELTAINAHVVLALHGGLDTYPMSDGYAVKALTPSPYIRLQLDNASAIGTPYTPVWIEDTNVIDGLNFAANDNIAPGYVAPMIYPFVNVIGLVVNPTNIVITVDTPLPGIQDGSYIGLYLDGSSMNQIVQVTTVVDSTDYLIDGTFSITWTPSTSPDNGLSNGRAMITRTDDVTAYLGGARVWRGDTVPSYVAILKPSQRNWDSLTNRIEPVSMDKILSARMNDTRQWKLYTDYSAPSLGTVDMEGGQRYVLLYPPPASDFIADLFTGCVYPDTLYNGRPMVSQIKLPHGFEKAVREYVMYEYYSDAKNRAEAQIHLENFNSVAALRGPITPGVQKINVRYT